MITPNTCISFYLLYALKLYFKKLMELKKRSKTVIDFQRAKSGTIVRLKSLTKFNGVL